jgi:predicted house-cleaning noncanonical NTP pyrophosphatase (MazG superfamily)
LPGELADVLEVLLATAVAAGLTWDQVVSFAAGKRVERGAFNDRVFLEYVDEP